MKKFPYDRFGHIVYFHINDESNRGHYVEGFLETLRLQFLRPVYTKPDSKVLGLFVENSLILFGLQWEVGLEKIVTIDEGFANLPKLYKNLADTTELNVISFSLRLGGPIPVILMASLADTQYSET